MQRFHAYAVDYIKRNWIRNAIIGSFFGGATATYYDYYDPEKTIAAFAIGSALTPIVLPAFIAGKTGSAMVGTYKLYKKRVKPTSCI